MKGDFSKTSFNASNHYASVRMQQGRVQIDSDWNEQMDIFDHRVKTETIDFIGGSGAPADYAGFKITVEDNNWIINAGRYYVDGLLCELEAAQALNNQTDYPDATLPVTDGVYLAYLDVWQRSITAVDDSSIVEVALNGADTATRLKNISQVKFMPVDVTDIVTPTCSNLFDINAPENSAAYNNNVAWQQLTAQSTGQLTPTVSNSATFDNQLYRIEIHQPGDLQTATVKWARDNASLAVSIQSIQGDAITIDLVSSQALNFEIGQWIEVSNNTYKLRSEAGLFAQIITINSNILTVTWIDTVVNPDEFQNGSLCVWENRPVSLVNAIETYSLQQIASVDPNNPESDIVITLAGELPNDIKVNQSVELTNSAYLQNNINGFIALITAIDTANNTITISQISNIQTLNLTLLKFLNDTTSPENNTNIITLENGLSIQFTDGSYKIGDYWLIAARANTNNIEWPCNDDKAFSAQSAFGITHAYSKLSLLQLQDNQWSVLDDCRTIFSPLSDFKQLDAVIAAPNAPHASIYIDNNGHIGIGIGEQAPVSQLHVAGDLTLESNLKYVSSSDHNTVILDQILPFMLRGTSSNSVADTGSFLKIGNQIIASNLTRGLTFIILNKQNPVSAPIVTTYDTYADASAANDLATALNNLTKQQLGILLSYDAWENEVTSNLQQAFLKRGLSQASNIILNASKQPYAAIFEGSETTTYKTTEVLQSSDSNAPCAEISGWLIDGAFNASGNAIPFASSPTPYSIPLADQEGLITTNWLRNYWSGGIVPNLPDHIWGLNACVVNNKIYVTGGVNPLNYPTNVKMYDPVSKQWNSNLSSMSQGRDYAASSAIEDKIYVMGGYYYGNILSSVEIYDSQANQWLTLPAMPTARWGLSSSVVNGKIYAIGGGSAVSNVYCSTMEMYDPKMNQWSTLSSMSIARGCVTSSVVNNKIYVIGGYSNNGSLASMEMYDPLTDKWTTLPSMPTARWAANSTVINNKIYVIGGTCDNTTALATVEMFDPLTNQWQSLPPIPTARCGFAIAVSILPPTNNAVIYAIGGLNTSSLSNVEVYVP